MQYLTPICPLREPGSRALNPGKQPKGVHLTTRASWRYACGEWPSTVTLPARAPLWGENPRTAFVSQYLLSLCPYPLHYLQRELMEPGLEFCRVHRQDHLHGPAVEFIWEILNLFQGPGEPIEVGVFSLPFLGEEALPEAPDLGGQFEFGEGLSDLTPVQRGYVLGSSIHHVCLMYHHRCQGSSRSNASLDHRI